VRPGQAEPELVAPRDQVTHAAPPGEQVVEELPPFRLLPAGHGQVRALEAFGGGGDRVIGRPQDGQAGRADRGEGRAGGQFTPEPPGRGQEQVHEPTQGDAGQRGLLPRPPVPGQLGGGEAAAAGRGLGHGGQVVPEQPDRHAAGLAARGTRDRGQIRASGLRGHAKPPPGGPRPERRNRHSLHRPGH